MHHIYGVNDKFFSEFGSMKKKYFSMFCRNHKKYNPICESSDILQNSYTMISPDGRFYQNTNEYYSFSNYILDAGVKESLKQLKFSPSKFKARKGNYYRAIK